MTKDISVITGGGGGMGRSIARELGKTTAIVLVGRNERRLQDAKAQLDFAGYESHLFVGDCGIRNDMEKLAGYAASLGNVKNVVNTAGIDPAYASAEVICKADAGGAVNVVRAFYPVIADGGVLINYSSIASQHAPDFLSEHWDGPGGHMRDFEDHPVFEHWNDDDFGAQFYEAVCATWPQFAFGESSEGHNYSLAGLAYCACKRFVNTFGRRNVRRFAKKGARILTIIPGCYLTPMHQGMIDTQPDEVMQAEIDMIPLKRWGHPYEMGTLVEFLCSSEAAFITGVEILADGGQMSNLKVRQLD